MCKALLGINVGSLNPLSPFYGQTNSVRNLSTDPYLANHDSLALTLVGKVGIGDIDISEDADFLYFVNLYDKKLYKLDITGATPVWAASYDIPADCVAGTGDARPFGLKVKDGKVYIGSVCDAYNSQNTSDMRAYVYALDETLGTFSIVFDFPLTYPKGYPYSGFKSISTWNPWTDDFSDFIPAYSYPDLLYPQPLFTDIEIDLDGSLILGFGDRTAYQVGWQNFGTQSSDPKLYVGSGAGDILRAAYINGTYVLENNAYVAGLTGASPNNNQGPGFGEFYNDNYPLNGGVHTEIAFGALALKPGSGESIYTTMDPEYGGNSGGFRYISNTTGTTSPSVIGATLYQTVLGTTEPTFGKAAGLGDLELACSLVSFLEIGNYVWIDADADGIQDPTESGIPNVQVRLYDQSGLLVGLTTTDTNGEYYFNPTNVDNNGVNATTGAATVGYTGLAPNTQYFIVLGQSGTNTFNATNDVLNYNGNEYALTNVNTGEGSVPDQNDSDASLASGVNAAFDGYPYIVANTGDVGSVDHTYDFGFTYGTIGNYVWTDTNSNGLQDEPTANGINGVTVELYQETSPGVFTLVQTTTTANDTNGNPGYYLFIIGQSANYQVKFPTTNSTNILTQQTTTAATDGNSDANATTGESPIFAMNILGTGVDKDNLTIDAGYRSCNLSISSISGTDVSCNGGSDGTASVTASGNLSPVTYLWSNGETTASISGLTAGTYSVTVTESATCTAVTSYTVNEPTALSVVCSKTDVTTNGGSDGTASVNATGGTSPYTYLWSSGETASSISGKTAGTYSVTVTDNNGCSDQCTTTIQEPGCNLSISSISGTDVSCNGGSDGTANVTASGNLSPVTYLWSNGETTASISGLTTGTYTVTVTENATCTAVTSYTVNEPTTLSVVCSKTDVTTNGGSDGTASVNATGGTSPYTYLWSSGETASSISGKTAGTYTVTVTDDNGCTAMCAQTITEPGVTLLPDLSLTKTVSNAIVALNGTVTFTLTLTNDNGVDATGVVVTDVLPAGVTFVSSSDPTNVVVSGNTLTWNVGNMLGTDAPKMLDITVTANSEGSFLNNAEITDMNETDTDSTPNNDVAGEDDQDQACFSVPASLCSDSPTASITITAATATTYQWYVSTDNGATYTPLSGETSQTLVVNNTLMGGNNITKYFKVAYNGSPITGACGDVMCCPIIITTQTCIVCPPPKCITIGITKH